MNTVKNLKLNIADWILRKKLKSVRRHKAVYNFDNAQTVGVLFSADDEKLFDVTNEFLHFLSQKKLKIFALGYIDQKEIPKEYLMNSKINFISRKDLSFFLKPKSHIAEQFIARDFDLLFDLSDNQHFPMKYINNLSRAHFKVGKEPADGKDYDFMINLGNNKDPYFYLEQIKEYIGKINK